MLKFNRDEVLNLLYAAATNDQQNIVVGMVYFSP
jgi:hypothetical protein